VDLLRGAFGGAAGGLAVAGRRRAEQASAVGLCWGVYTGADSPAPEFHFGDVSDCVTSDIGRKAVSGSANNCHVTTVKAPSNHELVLVMSDGTRETWTRAPAAVVYFFSVVDWR
jgi:hypothetical protein